VVVGSVDTGGLFEPRSDSSLGNDEILAQKIKIKTNIKIKKKREGEMNGFHLSVQQEVEVRCC
jgi:hypothetical protein